jgi:hypothetical protein
MSQDTIRVLLIGESEHACAHVRRLLEKRGCQCWFGRSFDEGAALFVEHYFHMILSTIPFRHYDRVLTKLKNLPSTVFQCCRVEDGCWWLPVVRQGKECVGAPALRASEFLTAFDQIVAEVRPRTLSRFAGKFLD